MRATILLIDDSASLHEVPRVTLESDGYAVLEAANGSENERLCRTSSDTRRGTKPPHAVGPLFSGRDEIIPAAFVDQVVHRKEGS